MTVLLVSTYELGHQPIHLASPAAVLMRAGHTVLTADLSVSDLDLAALDDVDGVAFSVPMHTAMRLAVSAARRVRASRPGLPIAFYGLYADVGADRNLGTVTDAIFCGEYEPDLVRWVSALGGTEVSPQVRVHLGRSDFVVPKRDGLPGLEEYARLEYRGEAILAGAVEASHGCRHRCRHCPIPAVYDGRMRVVGHETVLADIAQLAAAGARHITFADADFLNAPAYSIGILEAAHSRFPDLTFDVTVKVEHIVDHRELWPRMADLGVLFVVSAFESVDEKTLTVLDKGHTVADMSEAVKILDDAGIAIRPTWLPFMPWTTPEDIAGIVRFIDANGLSGATDPVQLAIKLLVPEGSLLVDHQAMARHLTRFDAEALTWLWEFENGETAVLFKELDRIAAEASDCSQEASVTLGQMRHAISSHSGLDLGSQPLVDEPAPRLSESWFCCAEPTAGQAMAVDGIGSNRG